MYLRPIFLKRIVRKEVDCFCFWGWEEGWRGGSDFRERRKESRNGEETKKNRRLAALEECRDLGQGFQLAERDMGIRGFGNIFGEQQTGDIDNVGIDLFFEMLFESLPKVEEHRLASVSYRNVQLDINITPHHSSEYINYLENPLELINEAEQAAEMDIWCLMQFTEDLRRQYGKEPRLMEILLKKLYVRRMAADLGISKIYAIGKIVCMGTKMSKKVFRIMTDSMSSDIHRNSLVFAENEIKEKHRARDLFYALWVPDLFMKRV